MKKVLSLVLVIAMVLSSMSFAFAAKFDDVAGDYEKAVDVLSALGVIKGYEDGTFRPEASIKRSELAVLLVNALGYGDLVAGSTSSFGDMKGHWADGYVAIASGTGLVIGYPNGTFLPEKTVTYDEALTMVIRALGYTDASLKGTWPTNFKVKAIDLGLTKGVEMAKADADRGGVAQVFFNALGVKMVEVNDKGVAVALDPEVLLVEKIGDKLTKTEIGLDNLNSKHDDYYGDLVDLTPYMYQKVDLFLNADGEAVFVSKVYDTVVEGTFTVPTTPVLDEIKVELADGTVKTIVLDDTANYNVYYNGSQVVLKELEMEQGKTGIVSLDGANVRVILNSDDTVKAIVADNATFGNQIVRTYKSGATTLGRINLPQTNAKVDLTKVTVTGAVTDIADVEVDDIVIAYAAGGADSTVANPSKVKLVISRDTVEGKVTRVDTSGNVFVDGVKYGVSAVAGATSVALTDEGTFFLDDAGNIFAKAASTATDASDYAVVIEKLPGLVNNGRVVLNAEMKLLTAKGEKVTYPVDLDALYQGTNLKIVTKGATDITFNNDANGDQAVTASLVKYKLNDDGEISRLDIVEVNVYADVAGANLSNVDTTKASFDPADDVVIFNIKTNNTTASNYAVVDANALPKTQSFTYHEINKNGEYKVLVIAGTISSTGKFGIITSLVNTLDKDNNPIVEITAKQDGEDVVYLTTNANFSNATSVTAIDANIVNKGKVVEFTTNNDGKVTGITVKDPAIAPNLNYNDGSYISNASGSRIEISKTGTTSSWKLINIDKATVYVLKSDSKLSTVGHADDLIGYDLVALYEVDGDTTNGFDIIVVK